MQLYHSSPSKVHKESGQESVATKGLDTFKCGQNMFGGFIQSFDYLIGCIFFFEHAQIDFYYMVIVADVTTN